MDVKKYSYFVERRDTDKRWVATVEEFPALEAASKIHNRAINDLYAAVETEVLRRHHAGEPIPAQKAAPSGPMSEFVKALGLG